MAEKEEEEDDWGSSKIVGFSFGDDDKTPFEELNKYQSISSSAAGGTKDNDINISFEQSGSGVISDKVKSAAKLYSKAFLEGETSISEALSGSDSSSGFSDYLPTDPKELRAELIQARRTLSKVEQMRFTPLHSKETVQNIFMGSPVALEFYKSFKQKQELLDDALMLNDGDAILAVTLFLSRTLSRSKFLELLYSRPTAAHHLANFYEDRHEIDKLTDLLTSLGQHEKAALFHYKQACNTQNLEARTKRIKGVLQSHFHGHPDSNLLIQHIHLLERIAPIIYADKHNPDIANDPIYPALSSEEESVLRTLLYFCMHHWGAGENLLHSPNALKRTHVITEKQWIWTALQARALKSSWADCEALVFTKGWLGGKKTHSAVSLPGVVRLLHRLSAPPDVLQNYIAKIDDMEEKESLARKCNAHNVVVDCLVMQKDRLGLQAYRNRLVDPSPEWHYANNALINSNTRWKN